MIGITKVAADAVVAALRTAGPTLRKLANANAELEQANSELRRRVQELEQRDVVAKLAHEMHEKHLSEGRTLKETQELLLEKAASGDLDLYQRAVELSAQRDIFGTPGGGSTKVDPLEHVVFDE